MKISIVTPGYPSESDRYNCGFIHTRCLEMIRLGHDVTVYRYASEVVCYEYEGVKVECAPPELVFLKLRDGGQDVVFIHFISQDFIKQYFTSSIKSPFVVWFHGFETLSWKRRLFNFKLEKKFASYIRSNIKQLRSLKSFIVESKKRGDTDFVYVSKWMHRIAENDVGVNISNHHIVPNPISCEIFKYIPKPMSQRLRVLSIRPYSSRKYANDIAIRAVELLSKRPEFDDFNFLFIGEGNLFNKLTSRIAHHRNVTVKQGFLNHKQIAAIHKEHGVFLCPTRQDAQGVSMCEAMASGLVPLTSNSTAIPEFVEAGVEGYLTDGPRDIVEALLELHKDPALFTRLSSSAAEKIRFKCKASQVVAEELKISRNLVDSYAQEG